MIKTNWSAVLTGVIGSAVLNGGTLMANPAQEVSILAPVIQLQTPSTFLGSGTSTPVMSDSNSDELSAPRSSGAINSVGSDYYQPDPGSQAPGIGLGNKLPLRLGVTVQLISDDNVNIQPGHKQYDFLEVVTPSVTLETSRMSENHPFYLGLNFDPTITFYDVHSRYDTQDYHVSLNGQYKFSKFLVGVTQTYDTNSGANVEFNGRLNTEIYNTRAFATGPLTDKINLSVEGIQTITNYSAGYDNDQWVGDAYVDYAVLPKLRLGVGTDIGFLDFQDSFNTNHGQFANQGNDTDQTFQQGNLSLKYTYSDKLNLTAKFGGEVREYEGAGDSTTPVMDIGATWLPFVHTTVSTDIFRRTVAAIAQNNQDYDYTGFTTSINQGFLRRFNAGLTFGYNNSSYYRTTSNQPYAGLTYNYYTVRPSLAWTPNEHFTVAGYYEYQKNASSIPGSGFEDNQVGLSGSFTY